MCAVDLTAPNSSMDIVGERWMGNTSLLETNKASYCLPPHERLTQRRIAVLRIIFCVGADDNNGEDWWDSWRYDLGVTSLMALRYPMLYSNNFLKEIIEMTNNPNVNGRLLRQHHVARLPGRGLVSTRRFDGLFSPETIRNYQGRIGTTIQRLREFKYEGLESLLDGEPVDESLILWTNRGAFVIFEAMSTRCLIDGIPHNDTDEVIWTDLCIGLRGATDSPTAAIYTPELCEKLVELAGFPIEDLYEEGWLRHQRAGILPIGLIPSD